jgi:hypothetical protein
MRIEGLEGKDGDLIRNVTVKTDCIASGNQKKPRMANRTANPTSPEVIGKPDNAPSESE